MKTRSMTRLVARAFAAVLLASGLAACSGTGGSTSQPTTDAGANVSQAEPTSDAPPAATPAASKDADQADDDRQGVVTLVEAQFQAFNAQANWEADTLVLTLDGDVNNELDGFLICGTIHEMIEANLKGRVEFPNGTLDCEEIRS